MFIKKKCGTLTSDLLIFFVGDPVRVAQTKLRRDSSLYKKFDDVAATVVRRRVAQKITDMFIKLIVGNVGSEHAFGDHWPTGHCSGCLGPFLCALTFFLEAFHLSIVIGLFLRGLSRQVRPHARGAVPLF